MADKSQKTETAFKLFDRNKDGYISRDEFTKVENIFVYCLKLFLKFQVSKKLTPSQIQAVFAKFDANGDGRLSMEEFRQMMDRK